MPWGMQVIIQIHGIQLKPVPVPDSGEKVISFSIWQISIICRQDSLTRL